MSEETTQGPPAQGAAPGLLAARLAIALAQGLILYATGEAIRAHASIVPGAIRLPLQISAVWHLFALRQMIYLVPLVPILALGALRIRTLAIWTLVAGIGVFGLASHAALRGQSVYAIGALTQFPQVLATASALFITHVLVTSAVIERRPMSSYGLYFEIAWKTATQLALALLFSAVFWAILLLGAELFGTIGIDAPTRLIRNPWFYFPAGCLAVAASIHLTDLQPGLLRGARWLVLSLFSWLLPVLDLLVLAFLVTLPFVSLAPLWATHAATLLLLSAGVLTIFLINCSYQDGNVARTTSWPVSAIRILAAWELMPLTGLAGYGLWLRVAQYGWSVERILAGVVLGVMACYALGYAAATVSKPRLKHLEITNLVVAYLTVVLVLCLYSPVADPGRLMVMDQMARLKSGAVTPGTFDFGALKFSGARWGAKALADLVRMPGADDKARVIRQKAAAAMAATSPWQVARTGTAAPSPEAAARNLKAHIDVYPPGRSLPGEFYDQAFWLRINKSVPVCTTITGADNSAGHCLARFFSPGGDQAEMILFIDAAKTQVFAQAADGHWQIAGEIADWTLHCPGMRRALTRDAPQSQPHALPDLMIDGRRFAITPPTPVPATCPP